MTDTLNILGVKITATNLEQACQCFERWIDERFKTYVCVAPVSTIVDCQSDLEYRKIVNSAGMVTPDGMPLVWLGRWKGHKNTDRTYGPDLLLAFCELSEAQGYKHYFYGGSVETNQLLVEKLLQKFSNLKIVGNFAPPLRQIKERESQDILEAINQAAPDVLWVGLGSPKQDYWMRDHREALNVPVMIGVGAAFDFVAGTKLHAPRWIQRSGLEWFFRLCCEPRRLWRRYLIGNATFIVLLIKEKFQRSA